MPDRQNGSIPRAVLFDPGFVQAWFIQSSVYSGRSSLPQARLNYQALVNYITKYCL